MIENVIIAVTSFILGWLFSKLSYQENKDIPKF